MKKSRTKFESFARKFLIVSAMVFMIGIIFVKSLESTYLHQEQVLTKEIASAKSDIDSLKMQKQELVSFSKISTAANNKGYSYQNNATASTSNR